MKSSSNTKDDKNLAAFLLNRSHPERTILPNDIESVNVKSEESSNLDGRVCGVREVTVFVDRRVNLNSRSPMDSEKATIKNYGRLLAHLSRNVYSD